MAKLIGARVAREVANRMLQVHGGYGFSDEYAISKVYRDARSLDIVGVARGAGEPVRLMAGKGLLRLVAARPLVRRRAASAFVSRSPCRDAPTSTTA